MAYCCSQCSFTAQFESSMTMHRQLHHETEPGDVLPDTLPNLIKEKSKSMPRDSSPSTVYSRKLNKGFKLPGRTTSATKLFGKIRDKICRSKTLFSHPEEPIDQTLNNDISARSECTSKALKLDSVSRITACIRDTPRETYGCHICSFEADRITVLDRHLLNDHKIGLENLLKLVLAKTKDGLSEDAVPDIFGIRQPYYKPLDEIFEDGEFIIETVVPKIKILKHTATNTDIQWQDIPDLKDNCRMITKELSDLMKYPAKIEKNDLLDKIHTLNDYMCKFIDSSNTLKMVLNKEGDGRPRKDVCEDTIFELGLGDMETPREWQRAHSEKIVRNRHADKHRGSPSKLSADSFYY